MPTTDPVKRRKQNCENQKRWRQRQFDTLQTLSGRVQELETESDDLRSRLQDSQAELETLRAAAGRLEAQASPSLGRKLPILEDANRDVPTSRDSNILLAVSDDQRPKVEGVQASTVNGSSQASRTKPIFLDNTMTTSYLAGYDWSSFVISGNVEEASAQPPLHTEHSGTSSDQKSERSYYQGYEYTSWAGAVPSEDESQKSNSSSNPESITVPFPEIVKRQMHLGPLDVFQLPVRDLESSESAYVHNDMEAAEEPMARVQATECVNIAVSYSNDLYFNWPMYSILGGAGGIWRNMTNFPDTTNISQHILAVQKVLHDSFRQLLTKPTYIREKVVADAFAWMIQSAWPSSESCFKMMTVYRHIFNFEVFRIFPCKATLERIHPLYRPTELQARVAHSPAIDWLPWPNMREKAIRMQHKVNVDRLCQMCLEHTLVEPAPFFTRNQPQLAGSAFRIWDMYLLEKAGGGRFSISKSAMTYDPASQDLLALVQRYGLPFQKIEHLRIDGPFYQVFPEFEIAGCASRWQTVPLSVSGEEKLGYPSKLKPESLLKLQKRVNSWLTNDP
ncbi:hypothetical protein LTR47_003069 [Exophiala xenobiotica]|nr:hypothetical protein LTR47_003069 [Exophiala xenobiotica]KAK5353828.1 hypothetical protein LTR61_002522 [Exophiala xenobiotica]KAK5370637.1 hypothetical protein LTR11_006848 [Exophiala xenobiotica]